jgi:hypothetical protein
MNTNRFKMSFNNYGSSFPNNLGVENSLTSLDRKRVSLPPRNTALNAPMVDRVHKAKPGCGACGKKVA